MTEETNHATPAVDSDERVVADVVRSLDLHVSLAAAERGGASVAFALPS